MKKIMKLYWAETDDHDEDWFVVAPSARIARKYHEDAEGYGRGEARVSLVCRLPISEQNHPTGWPDEKLLVACGGKIAPYIPDQNPEKKQLRQMMNVVETAWIFNSQIYIPGDIVENSWHRNSPKETRS